MYRAVDRVHTAVVTGDQNAVRFDSSTYCDMHRLQLATAGWCRSLLWLYLERSCCNACCFPSAALTIWRACWLLQGAVLVMSFSALPSSSVLAEKSVRQQAEVAALGTKYLHLSIAARRRELRDHAQHWQ